MNRTFSDPLWEHFSPLWRDMQAATERLILVAGGHGLLLKQNWLLANPEVRAIAHPSTWRNSSPRATKDLDLVVALDLISHPEAQRAIMAVIARHGFEVGELPHEKRWKFVKKLSEDRSIIVELHAQLPEIDDSNFKMDKFRIKSDPSLGADGFHVHQNAEAVGCTIQTFDFTLLDLNVLVPNPLTWSIMKLTAFRDWWEKSQKETSDAEKREFARGQAIKHADDVCRIVAMTTLDERNGVDEVRAEIATSEPFIIARQVFHEYFESDSGIAIGLIRREWETKTLVTIRETLDSWFK